MFQIIKSVEIIGLICLVIGLIVINGQQEVIGADQDSFEEVYLLYDDSLEHDYYSLKYD